jgi:tetratricopeptide (TPR) repeat protein
VSKSRTGGKDNEYSEQGGIMGYTQSTKQNYSAVCSKSFVFCATALIASVLIAGCNTTVEAPKNNSLTKLSMTGQQSQNQADSQPLASEQQSHENFEAEMEIEGEVSKRCVEAWRKALKGDKKGALADLDTLSKTYPNVATITFMKGQVLDHLGDKKEAIAFYKQAITNNEFSTMRIFKLAEALRATNQNAEAVKEYRRLLAIAPDFVPGKIGLAKSLLATDKASPEAKKQLESALTIDGTSTEARKTLALMK